MSVETFRAKINEKFGTNVISPADLGIVTMPRFSTGILSLDIDSGGGWPENRIIEIYGPESSGKTFVLKKAMSVITNRSVNNKVLLIDEEGDFDESWARSCGVNIKNLEVCKSEYAEQALDIMELGIQSGEFAMVALDSIAALVPKDEKDNSHEDWQMGLTARLMNKACRKAYKAISEAKRKGSTVTVFFVNQIREKLGVMWGNPETTPGGRGVKFAASIRLDLRKDEMLSLPGDVVYGQITKYFFAKNKTAPPLRRNTFSYILDGDEKGSVQNLRSLAEIGVSLGEITKAGSWFSGGWLKQKCQGIENVITALKAYTPDELNQFVMLIQKEMLNDNPLSFRF